MTSVAVDVPGVERDTSSMDVNYFRRQRTQFIRHFYDAASAPMIETKRCIDSNLPPFDDPPYDESGEPAYLEEWLRADAEIEVVGRTAVSLLSESLKQFFATTERESLQGIRPCQQAFPAVFSKQGFVAGYLACFGDTFNIDWSQCPADLAVIEQVVLARNDSQHQGDLVLTHIEHSPRTRERFPRPFFMRPDEPAFDDNPHSFMSPSIHVNRGTLIHAVAEVEQFCEWLLERIEAHRLGQP
jgi:hypothetical protein